jgi:hypothetical protein
VRSKKPNGFGWFSVSNCARFLNPVLVSVSAKHPREDVHLHFLVEAGARREQVDILLFDLAGGGHIFGILMAAVTAIGVQHFLPSTGLGDCLHR